MTTSSSSTCITRSASRVALTTALVCVVSTAYAQGSAPAPAATDTLTLTPASIPPGTHPPIRVVLPASAGRTAADASAVVVTIAGQPAKTIGPAIDANTLVVDPPVLDISGDADVRAKAGEREIARATLRYGTARERGGMDAGWLNIGLLFVYVTILVAFVFMTVWEDMRRGYNSLSEARRQLMEKIAPGSLTDGQLTALTAQLQQAPAGIEGLARTTIAFTLLLVIGIAVFHIIVASQIGGTEVPPVIERILTLLAGALTSITGFYFGARAAQSAGEDRSKPAVPAEPAANAGTTPAITPAQAKPGAEVVISGSGFGQEVGAVTFGSIPADMTKGAAWNDTRIKVVVPTAARPGPAPITITRGDRHQIALASTAFTVLPPDADASSNRA